MPAEAASSRPRGRFILLASAAAVSTYLLIVLGGIVRATGSGLGCPDWPLCRGGVIPPFHPAALIEYSHRLAAAFTSPLILLTAFAAWRGRRPAARAAILGAGLLAVQVLLGAVTVRLHLPPEIVAAHLGTALAILGLQIWVVVAGWMQGGMLSSEGTVRRTGRVEEGLALVSLFLVLVSGAWVAGSGADFACTGWPLCGGVVWPAHALGRVHMLHRGTVLASTVFLAVLARRAWVERFVRPAAAIASAVMFSLYLAQATIGAAGVLRGFPQLLVGLHVATASAAWGSLVMTIALRAWAPARTPPLAVPTARWTDYLALTKPIIVGLLLVTTISGMVLGAGGWPGNRPVLLVLVAGALSAGGASALNQYIDRDRDRTMARTRRRPLPRGVLGPAEALSFGLVLCVAGFFLFALGVNLLSALLALTGMLYYVLLYSLALKSSTPQNIVIGGGAGAIPPLVGWAAATGRVEVGALFLFALVFFWTPPHFWALALVRQKDYESAGIPMHPVIYGERETRRHILLYSVQVVALSLLLPLARLGGGISFVAAVVLGALFLAYAWKLWREGGRRLAWGLYRYSSMYLALIFATLVVDTLV